MSYYHPFGFVQSTKTTLKSSNSSSSSSSSFTTISQIQQKPQVNSFNSSFDQVKNGYNFFHPMMYNSDCGEHQEKRYPFYSRNSTSSGSNTPPSAPSSPFSSGFNSFSSNDYNEKHFFPPLYNHNGIFNQTIWSPLDIKTTPTTFTSQIIEKSQSSSEKTSQSELNKFSNCSSPSLVISPRPIKKTVANITFERANETS
jgi:hypothetical protein